MIAARHIVRSLEDYGDPNLQTVARLVAAGGNEHLLAMRYSLTPRQVKALPILVEAVAEVEAAEHTPAHLARRRA